MRIIRLCIVLGLLLGSMENSAQADINIFINGLNDRAYATPMDYNYQLSNQFGLPQPQVASLLRSVAVPGDAFMVLQLARMLGMPYERVLHTYNADRGRGWGNIAKDLGIKPGSAEFHALKNGNFSLTGVPGGGKPHGKDKGPDKDYDVGYGKGKHGNDDFLDAPGLGKGKGKGHNK